MLGLGSIAAKIFGTSNDRKVKQYLARVPAINALEAETEKLSDAELKARTEQFRKQLADGTPLRTYSCLPSPLFARLPSAPWDSVILTFSSSAAWFSTKAASPK